MSNLLMHLSSHNPAILQHFRRLCGCRISTGSTPYVLNLQNYFGHPDLEIMDGGNLSYGQNWLVNLTLWLESHL